MKRDALIRELRRYARKNGYAFEVSETGGKGGHYKVSLGGRWTIIQSGELRPHYINTICKQLGIPRRDIRR